SSCNHTFPNDAADRRLHENGLIGELLYLDIARHGLENVGHGSLHSRRDGKGGGAAIFEDTEQCAADTVLANDVFLREITITHLRHIADVNHGPADTFYRQVVQQIDSRRVNV